MTDETVRLDAERHAITVGGRTRRLQEKAWQVVKMLAGRYPGIVRRADIVDDVWSGNAAVGEKGLNQAIWQLRRVLEDDAREPRVIRTIPRVGYQWLQPPGGGSAALPPAQRTWPVARAAMLAALACIAGLAAGVLLTDRGAAGAASLLASKLPATGVYLEDRDVHVIFDDGTIGVLKNANRADVQSPVLSEDGYEIAVAVREANRCRMVTIDLLTRERQDFGECPTA